MLSSTITLRLYTQLQPDLFVKVLDSYSRRVTMMTEAAAKDRVAHGRSRDTYRKRGHPGMAELHASEGWTRVLDLLESHYTGAQT